MIARAAFAVPGDLTTLTGGYIYDRRLLHELRAMGIDVTHIALPGSFPGPSAQDMDTTFAQLATIVDDCPVIIDGLAFGAMDPARVVQVHTPIVALIHHPLALENGLDPDRARELYHSERANLAHAVQVIVPSPHTAALLVSDYGVLKRTAFTSHAPAPTDLLRSRDRSTPADLVGWYPIAAQRA
ncbi:hypothetical protein [Yoonia sp. GPGPB17]|uniref:hypothetical protein n=1 Tax=Yoonia sp. GPGPB17 TaxID=3026147 RepID=UPI0030EF03B4